MMAEWTPSEQELLEYVEGELDPDEAERVRLAIAASPELAETVAGLERARRVLRASPVLELPEKRWRALLEELPQQERERRGLRALFSSPKRVAAVFAPVAVAVVAVVVITTTTGGEAERQGAGTKESVAAQTAAAATAPLLEGAQEDAGAAPEASPARTAAATVEGPAREVVRVLREAGFTAKRVQGGVEVTGATAQDVTDALAGRPAGRVQVFVTP